MIFYRSKELLYIIEHYPSLHFRDINELVPNIKENTLLNFLYYYCIKLDKNCNYSWSIINNCRELKKCIKRNKNFRLIKNFILDSFD